MPFFKLFTVRKQKFLAFMLKYFYVLQKTYLNIKKVLKNHILYAKSETIPTKKIIE